MRQLKPPSVAALFMSFFHLNNAIGQADSLLYTYQDAIENNVSASGDAAFDYDAEFEYLQDFIRNPLNINSATAAEFEKLRLLSAEQIAAIISHRNIHNKHIDLVELQTILPLALIKKILPFIYIDGNIDDFQMPINQWFKKGKNVIITRFEHRLEKAKGYLNGNFEGDANRVYMRYRYTFGNRLSYGLTLEKDAGESIKKSGFDFASAHFQISDAHKFFKIIVLGDYTISLGQGLIHENGFAINKSALVLSIEKDPPPLRFYASANEANFLRGVATKFKLSQHTEGVFFASHRRRDGNILNPIAVDSFNKIPIISALQFSGLHRTDAEISDKNRIGVTTLGGSLQHRFRRFTLGLNTVFNRLDGIIKPTDKLYNFSTFKGQQLGNFSTNYKTNFKNIHCFGETALSSNAGFATLNGLLVGLDKQLSISILHRLFSKNYQSINAQPFAESNRTQDEKGVYFGLEYKFNRSLSVDFYADFWTYQWLKFGVDKPSSGREFFGKITYKVKNTEGYIQLRNKLKQENSTRLETAKVNNLADKTRTQIRLQYSNKITNKLELRNRVEFSNYDDQKAQSKGFMVWQDVIFKLPNHPLSMSSRLAYFDTKDYNSAIYAFENDISHSFTILPYYFRGSRFYVNASYKFLKRNHIEVRLSRTHLTNQTSFGSGLDQILGNKRTDFKIQYWSSF